MLSRVNCDNASLLLHMLNVIEAIGEKMKSPEVWQELVRLISLILAESQAGALVEHDRQAIHFQYEAL